MTCNEKCIHFPVCEQKNYDFARIEECPYYDERTQNEWIDNGQGHHFCKSCGYFALYQTKDSKTYFEKLSNFCPHCGARMEADNEQ